MRPAQLLRTMAAAGLAAWALAGCAATPRYATEIAPASSTPSSVAPAYPTRSSTPSRPIPYESLGRAAPSIPVEQAPLPQAAAGRNARLGRNATPAPAAVSTTRPPAFATPRQVTVREGDTLALLGERWRTPVSALIEANRLQAPYDLRPGSTLIIPPPLVYEAQDGDTLFGVARRFAMDPRSLANLNDIPLETPLVRGRRLALPSLARDGGSNGQASGPPPTGLSDGERLAAASQPRLREQLSDARPPRAYARPPGATGVGGGSGGSHLQPKTTADAQAAVAAAAAREPSLASGPVTDNQVSHAGRGRFVWPLNGRLLSGFGAKGPGQRNDGVDLAASAGEPVKAAAGGEVVYAGGAIPSFGNLVLVKHAGGWVTAYGHLAKIEVAMRQSVSQGQEIGQAGQTGTVDQPQLHFEVRYAPDPSESAKPIDPALVLPRSGQ